jgi:transposase-like protein
MKHRKRYTKEFQLRAARLVVEQGYTRGEAAERLGTTTWSIQNWIKKYRASGELGEAESPPKASTGSVGICQSGGFRRGFGKKEKQAA